MSYKSHYRGSRRVFDHLYDPIYKTSGPRDVWRANGMALSESAPIRILPVFDTMFTDLPRRPRNYYMMQQNPLPHYPFTYQQPQSKEKGAIVDGVDRAKYFDIPIGSKNNVRLNLDMPSECCCPIKEELFKNQECQTIYRESSAQTKPWMPDAVISEPKLSNAPEIIQVADLIEGDTLPGLYEVELIERARKHWAWESLLPPLKSVHDEDWSKRELMIEAFEWEKWIAREEEIEDCQKIRMKIVMKMMDRRKEKMERNSEQRLVESFKRMEEEKERKIQNMRIKHERAIRRLETERKGISRQYKPETIAQEHIDTASQLYGPQQCFGVHPKHRHFVAFKTNFEARLEKLHVVQPKSLNLERYINPKDDLTLPKGPLKEVKLGLWTEKSLQALYDSLKAFGQGKPAFRDNPLCLEYAKKSCESISSNSLYDEEEIYEEDFENAAVSKQFFNDGAFRDYKEITKIEELIADIRAFNRQYNLDETMNDQKKMQKMERKRMENIMRIKKQIDDILQTYHGGILPALLEFLNDEVVRLQNEKRDHALYMLAEKDRQEKLAVKMARKAADDRKLYEQETIIRNGLQQNVSIATEYLKNIQSQCFEQIAEDLTCLKMREVVWQIKEENRNTTNEQLVRFLVTEEILPNIFDSIDPLTRGSLKLKKDSKSVSFNFIKDVIREDEDTIDTLLPINFEQNLSCDLARNKIKLSEINLLESDESSDKDEN